MVIDMPRKPHMLDELAERLDRELEPRPEAFAPTATFRWAKSSPSAPAVLQQRWIGLSINVQAYEWRDVETVDLGEDPAAA